MSKANHYLLNLHHNNPRFTRLYNDKLTYRVTEDKYLLALYDESFYNLYKAGNSKGTYYGTITNSCYNFDGSEFKFLTVYPELGKSTVGYDGAKFALGKITLGVNEKLLLQPTSRGNELLVYNTDTRTKVNVRCAVNVGLPNDFSSDEIQSWDPYGFGEFLIIPQRDITSSQGKRFEKSKYYLLDKSTPLNKIELKEFNIVNDFASPIVSGQLTDTTALVREVEVSTGSYNYHLWTGNPFTGLGETKGVLKGDEKIALFRGEDGDFKYYFSKSDGSEASEPGRGLQLYCQGRENCKMENLNLIPNIKTYLKSMIVSADIADIANAPTVNEANIIAGLVDRVAGKLVTDKADELGKVIFEKPIPKIQNKTLAEYVEQEMPKSIARDSDFQDTVAVALRSNPGAAKGPKGDSGSVGQRGPAGRDGPTLSQVTTDLITNKATELGKAVINADLLNQQYPLSSKITYWVKDLLRRDQEFRNDVKGDPGEDGISTSADDVSSTLIRDDTFIQKILLKEMIYPRQSGDRIPRKLSDWVTYLLKQDDEFKRSVKGDTGPTGSQGPVGPRGLQGLPGSGATASQVANELVNQKAIDLGKAVLDVKVNRKSLLVEELKKEPSLKGEQGPAGPQGPVGPAGQNGTAGATAREVAGVLVNQKAHDLGKAVLDVKVNRKSLLVEELKKEPSLKGEQGPAGPQGPEGKQGQKGDKGDKGDSGAIGPRGPEGKQGPIGLQGPEGKQGQKGDKGDKGDSGAIGPRGPEGKQGPIGLQGPEGKQGQKGEKGDKGDSGAIGPRGPVGNTGAPGKDGAVGPEGPQGPEGKQGQKGEKGDKGDSGAIGPRGPVGNTGAPGKDGAVGPEGPQGPEGKQGPIGPPGEKGDPGKGSDPSEIVHRLAHSSRFKRSLKGEDGEPGYNGKKGDQGQPGIEGLPGLDGRDGQDADPAEVAEKLISNKTDELVNIIRQEVVDRVTTWGASKRLVDSLTYDDILRIIEGKADTGRHKLFERLLSNANLQDPSKAKTFIGNEVAGNADLQNAVADALRNDPGNARGPRGRDGRKGERGEDGAAGPRGDLGQDADSSEIVHRLAHSSRFKRLLKGEDGEKGEQGPPGQDGVDGVQGPRGRAGEKGKKGEDGPDGPQGIQGERGEDGAQGLEGPQGLRGEKGENGMPGPPGPAGRDGVNSFAMDSKLQKSIEDLQKKPALKIVPGDTNENIQEANIELEGVGVIATFLEIGYFFKGNNLYIRNHITGKSILIPQDFHFLKVVEDGLDNYKLAFCNYLGNLFFDYRKYNSEYAGVLEEYKTIDLRYIKNAANIDLSKYYCHHIHSPLFAVKQGEFEAQSTENRSADVYEIVKDKKIGTLIDEFGFFEHEQFYYVNHHQGHDHRSQELNVTIEDHEGNFQIGDNIIHPIILHDSRLDLLDYLGYQNELM